MSDPDSRLPPICNQLFRPAKSAALRVMMGSTLAGATIPYPSVHLIALRSIWDVLKTGGLGDRDPI